MIKVLVVDDDEGVRESLSEALLDEFEVSTASSGENALEQIGRSKPQAMVLDHCMPGLSGLGLLEKLEGKDVPGTIMLSALADVDMARQAMHLGAEDLMAKPCDVNVLKRKLHLASERARPAKSVEVPFALRGARAVEEASSKEGSLSGRSQWLSKRVIAEAISESRGDRDLAAYKLGMSLRELDIMVADLRER